MSVVKGPQPFWVAGKPVTAEHFSAIRSPYSDQVIEEVALPGEADVERAVAAAVEALPLTASLPAHVRAAALTHVSRRLQERPRNSPT